MIPANTPGQHRELPRWLIVTVPGAYHWRYLVHPERDEQALATISPHVYGTPNAALDAGEEWTVLEEYRRRRSNSARLEPK